MSQFISSKLFGLSSPSNSRLINVDTNENFNLKFRYLVEDLSNKNIPTPPKRFYQLVERCTPKQKSNLIELREKILMFDYRIQELVKDGGIVYGASRNKYCVEIRLNSKKELVLFLWLPRNLYISNENVNINRFRIWTDWNKAAIVRPAARGLGKITACDIKCAKEAAKNHSLNKFIDEALHQWFERI